MKKMYTHADSMLYDATRAAHAYRRRRERSRRPRKLGGLKNQVQRFINFWATSSLSIASAGVFQSSV
ncbi:hypothetical protein, partial [Burkholderia gladioli]|uniref:hypothetical protein n=1 Tax=Burkholderia gladioli TaxID=28095 RepID=UPI001ABBC2C0